jgi:hypothetical protein
MTPRTIHRLIVCSLLAVPTLALAKLPAASPPTPEEKAKAAEAAAKTAWSNKVADFQLCRSMERAAANHFEVAKQRGAAAAADPAAPACTDPGPFKPPEAASAQAPSAAAAAKTPPAEPPKK